MQTEARKMIRKARACYVQVRFGTSEQWVRITKADATLLIRNSWSNDTEIRLADDGSGDVLLGG